MTTESGRPTLPAIGVEALKHAVALLLAVVAWSFAFGWGGVALPETVLAVVAFTLLGHVVPALVVGRVSWLLSAAVSVVLYVVWVAVASQGGEWGVADMVGVAALLFVVPVLLLTLLLRSTVPWLRTSPELRTPFTFVGWYRRVTGSSAG
ncbi:hypothetical protein [Cellulomonas sp.]|uniref:hypothetical protein n=1 Tax=Cellulomonas sp. TaxID=40001 RepID=UPI0025833E74|nr:hypothetical protein [Cellulomonas sp.]MCR6690594.1 hypothetical protein [Cellulomonas sp.]